MFNVYGILCKTTWKVYYGRTELTVEQRLEIHEKDYKRYLNGTYHYITSYEIIKNGNYEIKLLEKCDNKIHMKEREGYYIRTFPCVNKCIPGRTKKEYYETFKVEIAEYKKEYYEANKEEILEKKKEYRETFKEKIKEPYTCACGSIDIRKDHKTRHETTLKHKKYLASL